MWWDKKPHLRVGRPRSANTTVVFVNHWCIMSEFFFVEQLTFAAFAKHKTQLTARLQFSRFFKTHLVTSISNSSPFLHLFSRPQIFGALRGRTAKVGEKGAFGQVGRCDPTSHGGFLDEEFWYFKNWWSFWQMILGFKESIKNRIPLFSLCTWTFFHNWSSNIRHDFLKVTSEWRKIDSCILFMGGVKVILVGHLARVTGSISGSFTHVGVALRRHC